jgi:hypothetical protein
LLTPVALHSDAVSPFNHFLKTSYWRGAAGGARAMIDPLQTLASLMALCSLAAGTTKC